MLNPFVKLYWRIVMSGMTLWYRGDDLTLLNVGYASLDEDNGLFLEGDSKSAFDKYRLQLYH